MYEEKNLMEVSMSERNVSLSAALKYKGQAPYLTYILHRMGGAMMAIFITTHILATFAEMQGWQIGKLNIGDLINDIYISPPFQIIFMFGVLFHLINGMRITILDLFPEKLIPYHRQAILIEWIIFILVYGFAVLTTITTTIARMS
jgi:succinate dehydrogenase/fumarate reductase cytochrome b subunit